jgi:hypothetical protein
LIGQPVALIRANPRYHLAAFGLKLVVNEPHLARDRFRCVLFLMITVTDRRQPT